MDLNLVQYYLEGWACLCLCLVGTVINSYAIWTLVFRQKHTAIFHKLMLALVVYDLFYVVLSCLVYSVRTIWPYYRGERESMRWRMGGFGELVFLVLIEFSRETC